MPMLSSKHAHLAIRILALLLAAALSFFFVGGWLLDTEFIKETDQVGTTIPHETFRSYSKTQVEAN